MLKKDILKGMLLLVVLLLLVYFLLSLSLTITLDSPPHRLRMFYLLHHHIIHQTHKLKVLTYLQVLHKGWELVFRMVFKWHHNHSLLNKVFRWHHSLLSFFLVIDFLLQEGIIEALEVDLNHLVKLVAGPIMEPLLVTIDLTYSTLL